MKVSEMKNLYRFIVLLAGLSGSFAAEGKNLWTRAEASSVTREKKATDPLKYMVYAADEASLKQQLFSVTNNPNAGQVVTLPQPDGTMRDFRVWRSGLLPEKLAARYPSLRTFNAVAVDDRKVTAKLDYTGDGFHAMIFDGKNVSFVDPADNSHSGYYMAHYKKDETRPSASRMNCTVGAKPLMPRNNVAVQPNERAANNSTERTVNGYTLKTYRLALSCDNEYAMAATGLPTPTLEQTFSKMVTSMNRVNGVYERELSVTMNFVENEDTLIWNSATGSINGADPFDSVDGNISPVAALEKNQELCDARIGVGNYDIGHVFTTGAGGLSEIGVVCQWNMNATSVTGLMDPVGDGFDIDYVAHEMGHEYGASHPFNDDESGNCSEGTINLNNSYEPGSGSTIMAYAGICSPDDLQPHSDAYFNSVSLAEIQYYISSYGDGCPERTPTGNKLVSLPAFAANYTIPFETPFELTAPVATDSVMDTSITYCWEEYDLGTGQTLDSTHDVGPLFRSYYPTTSPTRVFPKPEMVLAGILSNAGVENNQGEKAPDVARTLNFHLTVRDIYNGYGCFLIPDDIITLDVINTGNGFRVTSQNDSTLIYFGNSPQRVTWNVVGTNAAPISAANVEVYASFDGGYTWPYDLGSFPNTGSATVTLPNPDTTVTTGRLKVKGAGNVFFNVNGTDFTVLNNDEKDTTIKLFPVPARDYIIVSSGDRGPYQLKIFNAIGQEIYSGGVEGELYLPIANWAPGVYLARFVGDNKQKIVKKFAVE